MQEINQSTIITAAEDYLLTLSGIIFNSKDFAKNEETISRASKIRLGLKALDDTNLSQLSQLRILTGLNKLCNIYNQQLIPQIIL